MTIATTTSTIPRNLKDRVASYPEVTYVETAFRGKMESNDVKLSFKPPFQCKPLPIDTHCHEYLAIDLMAGELKNYKEMYLNQVSLKQARYDAKVARKKPAKEPSSYYFYNFGLITTVWASLVKWIAIIIAGLGLVSLIFTMLVLIAMDGFSSVSTPKELIEIARAFLLFVALPYSIFLLFKFLLDRDILIRFNKIPGIRLILRRDTGMVQFKKKGRFIDVPFSEVMGMTRHHTDNSGIRRITLHLNHKHSKLNRNLDSGLQALGSALHENERWWYYLRWEFIQHYMDVTRPLPDIPELEPYRHLDPTTREWDKEHNRPKDYWLNMDDETYEKMVKASKEKAKSYPYDDAYLADDIGWTPAGHGKFWYQLG